MALDMQPQLTTEDEPFIHIDKVSKHFGGIAALSDVSFTIRAGKVHGLVGANGAGKSTLIRALAGISRPDSGTIEIDGSAVSITTPDDASALGLAFIHQEMSLIPGWDVLRNMSLGLNPETRFGLIDWRPTRARAREVATRLNFKFSLSRNVNSLSTADQWLVLIGRALMRDSRLIAMDEPTASLSNSEAIRLHQIVRELVAAGTAVIFVSHRLDEVSDLCDDITVFKDGAVTKRVVGERISKPQLIRAIVGRDIEIPEKGGKPGEHGAPVLQAENISDAKLLRNVNLTVHAGEIVGLGGLVGAGRTELAKILYGATRAQGGRVLLDGIARSFRQPADAVAAGIGLVPEERRSEGLFLDRSIDFNINLANLETLTLGSLFPFLNLRRGKIRAEAVAKQVTVKATSVNALVSSLSGGNQQKVVIARWLIEKPKILILDEPSRGVDVGARSEVHRVIRQLAATGTAILVISSDNEELVGLCDRVVVLTEGAVSGELVGPEITVDHIISLSFAQSSVKDLS